jgi:hypothetical protein
MRFQIANLGTAQGSKYLCPSTNPAQKTILDKTVLFGDCSDMVVTL